MNAADRPASLKRTPRPAKDDSVDPVDTTPVPSVEASKKPAVDASAPTPPRRREVKVPLSTLVSLDIDETIARVMSETGMTKRAVIETAIRDRWAK